jgi:glycogen debranching enzyme
MTMNRDTVRVLEGNTFVVSRPNGDVDAGPGELHGLFHRDTRHLSRWLLTVDGKQLDALSTDDTHSFSARFFLVPGSGSEYTDATASVIRRRVVGDGFYEELTVLNHGGEPMHPEIEIAVAADFADLFEVKDAQINKPGKTFARIDDGVLVPVRCASSTCTWSGSASGLDLTKAVHAYTTARSGAAPKRDA